MTAVTAGHETGEARFGFHALGVGGTLSQKTAMAGNGWFGRVCIEDGKQETLT